MSTLLNFIIITLSAILTLILYIISVQPVKLSNKYGKNLFNFCGIIRAVSVTFMFISYFYYFVFFFNPIQISILQYFPWPYWITLLIGFITGLIGLILIALGMHYAGMEAVTPQKNQILYKGIYKYIKHPQGLGEILIFYSTALILNSIFLFLFSFLWEIIIYLMMKFEEKDLLFRYGNEYKLYTKQTGFFIPKIGAKK